MVNVQWVEEPGGESTLRVNVERARAVVHALETLKRELALTGEPDVAFVARQPDVLTYESADARGDVEPDFTRLIDEATAALVAMRQREGKALARDLVACLTRLDELVMLVDHRAPERLVAERKRLTDRVGDLLDDRAIDRDRVALEIALLADKLDITEELVRLRTHIEAATGALTLDGPVGRKLAFLGQEMLREVNTIGSKANDAAIAQATIDMKGELERFREQVENLE